MSAALFCIRWAETLRDKTARLVTLVDSKGDTIHSCTTLRSYCQSYPDALLIVCRPWAEGQDHIGKRTSQGVVSDHPPALYATCGDIAILRLITDCYRPLADFQGLPMFILITAVDVGFEEDLAAAAKAIATCFGKAGPFVPDSVLGTFQNSWTPPPPNAEAQASSFDRCSSPVVLRSSAVSGEGISHLHRLLVNIPKRYSWSLETCKSPLFIVEEVYHRIDGPDIVLGGRVTQGVFSSNPTDTCAGYNVFCGPFPNGVGAPFREVCTDDLAERDWISVRLVSIHVHRIPVQRALAGQRCSFGLIFRPDKTGLTTDEQIRQLGRNMHRGCVVLNSQEV